MKTTDRFCPFEPANILFSEICAKDNNFIDACVPSEFACHHLCPFKESFKTVLLPKLDTGPESS